MRKAIDQDTLQALIETGAAREFRATRGPGGEGWTLATRLGATWLPVRSRREPVRLGEPDRRGALRFRDWDSRIQRRAVETAGEKKPP